VSYTRPVSRIFYQEDFLVTDQERLDRIDELRAQVARLQAGGTEKEQEEKKAKK